VERAPAQLAPVQQLRLLRLAWQRPRSPCTLSSTLSRSSRRQLKVQQHKVGLSSSPPKAYRSLNSSCNLRSCFRV